MPAKPRRAEPIAVPKGPITIPAPLLARHVHPILRDLRLPPPKPPTAPPSARVIGSTATSRTQTPVVRDSLQEPPVAPAQPRVGELPVDREPLTPPQQPAIQRDRLPDDVVMRLIESGRAAFVRCFKKAVEADPLERSFKVQVHVEVDGNGTITATTTDATNKKLDACLVRAAGWLAYPTSGRPVGVDFPLFYRAE